MISDCVTGTSMKCADLFCGAGGTSAGMYEAALDIGVDNLDLLAVNHWPVAIETHSKNHTLATHLCETLDSVDPRKVIPDGHLHIMTASPECTHHSIARGGKPCSDQSRASAWHVLRWADAIDIDNIVVENVPEFETWGPLNKDGKPSKSRKGETFKAWRAALVSLGYQVDHRVLNAADYGDPTSRRRLFVLASKMPGELKWPKKTHGPGTDHPHKSARGIIDWDYESQSIFSRKRPLAPNTINRIAAGIEKFNQDMAEPFLVMLRGGGCKGKGGARSVDRPCPTVAANGTHIGLAQPFLMHLTHHGNDKSRCHDVGNPTPTVTGAHRGELGLVEPFITHIDNGSSAARGNAQSIDDPLTTVIASNQRHALVEPFLTKYFGTGGAKSVDLPLDTVTTKQRFGLCEPVTAEDQDGNMYVLDIHFRMLQPHELAAAQSMEGFEFSGNKGEQVKQIGNAVPVQLARALCRTMMQRSVPKLKKAR